MFHDAISVGCEYLPVRGGLQPLFWPATALKTIHKLKTKKTISSTQTSQRNGPHVQTGTNKTNKTNKTSNHNGKDGHDGHEGAKDKRIALTIRLPEEKWRLCHYRLIDERISW